MASYYPKQEASNCKLRQQLRVDPLKDFQVSVIIIANELIQKTTISQTDGGITITPDQFILPISFPCLMTRS